MTQRPLGVLVRVDASPTLGIGHLMRCRTLARSMREQGAVVRFLIADGGARGIADLVTGDGFETRVFPHDDAPLPWSQDLRHVREMLTEFSDTQLVVVDHYGLDHRWESGVEATGVSVAVIDDLADREHDCDILLDQNLYENAGTRYAGLVPSSCRLLLGPEWALLRQEFIDAAAEERTRDGAVASILVSYGGSDPTGESAKAVRALTTIDSLERIDVVLGQATAGRTTAAVLDLASRDERVRLHHDVSDMAALMVAADLALGAGGATTWERAALGLPAIVTTVAANQAESASTLSDRGAILYLGPAETVSEADIEGAVRALAENSERVRLLSTSARLLMGTPRGSSAVAEAMLEVAHARS